MAERESFYIWHYLQLTGVNLMWIVLHSIFWDGNAANTEDVVDSLLTPGPCRNTPVISL